MNLRRQITQGSFSTIFQDSSNQCIKRVRHSAYGVLCPLELWIMRKLTHAHLMSANQIVLSLGHAEIYMTLAISDLDQAIRRQAVPSTLYKTLFVQLLSVVDYLHTQQIIHGDIKPHNVLVFGTTHWSEQTCLKLTDFSLSSYTTTQRSSVSYAMQYRPPEIWAQQSWNHTADLWSLGLVLYEIMYSSPLFKGSSAFDFQAIAQAWDVEIYNVKTHPSGPRFNSNSRWKLEDHWQFNAIILCLLHSEPRYRMTARQALVRLGDNQHIELKVSNVDLKSHLDAVLINFRSHVNYFATRDILISKLQNPQIEIYGLEHVNAELEHQMLTEKFESLIPTL